MTQAPPPAASPKTNGLAIASLVLGIASIVVCLGCLAGIPAIICGHLAMKQIAQRGEAGAGMAKAGLIIGYIITALSILIGILVAAGLVALPWAEVQHQVNMVE
jgi:hypothetical protein